MLPALLLLLLRHPLGVAPAAGAFIAISVHLTCNALSPAVGFGQVWLPAPFKTSLGAWSHLWLIGNAVLSFWLALRMARIAFRQPWSHYPVIGTAALVGASYGIINESSLLAAVASLTLPGAAHGLDRRQRGETAYQMGPRREHGRRAGSFSGTSEASRPRHQFVHWTLFKPSCLARTCFSETPLLVALCNRLIGYSAFAVPWSTGRFRNLEAGIAFMGKCRGSSSRTGPSFARKVTDHDQSIPVPARDPGHRR